MKSGIKKILLSTMALLLTVMLIAGLAEVVEMSGGPAVSVSVLASAGDPEPSSGGGGGGGSSTPSSSSSSSSSSYSSGSSGKSKVSTPAVKKKLNTMVVVGKTTSVSAASLASHSIKISRKKALSIKKAKGAVTFKKVKGNKKFKVDKKTGNIKVRKGLKKGTYKLRVRIHAAGSYRYRGRSRTRTVVIKVNGVANTLSAAGKTVEIGQDDLNSADVVIKRSNALNISKPVGAITYEKVSGNDGFSINAGTGDITVKKGTAEGEYQLRIKVTADGNSVYYRKGVTTTVTVTVKAAETPEPDAEQPASNDSTVNSNSDNTVAPAESGELNEAGSIDENGVPENQEP